MLVKKWMSKRLITIHQDDSMQKAIGLMKDHHIRMLPVINKEKLMGVVTDRDLRSASASQATTLDMYELAYLISRIKVKQVMSKNPITVPMDYTVEETAEVLLKNRINGVPVVDLMGKAIGVITQTDILRVLISFTGLTKNSIQFGFVLADQPGSIKAVTDIIRAAGGRISSILGTYENVQEGYRHVYVSAYNLDPAALNDLKSDLGAKTKLLYMVDYCANKREVFALE